MSTVGVVVKKASWGMCSSFDGRNKTVRYGKMRLKFKCDGNVNWVEQTDFWPNPHCVLSCTQHFGPHHEVECGFSWCRIECSGCRPFLLRRLWTFTSWEQQGNSSHSQVLSYRNTAYRQHRLLLMYVYRIGNSAQSRTFWPMPSLFLR